MRAVLDARSLAPFTPQKQHLPRGIFFVLHEASFFAVRHQWQSEFAYEQQDDQAVEGRGFSRYRFLGKDGVIGRPAFNAGDWCCTSPSDAWGPFTR
jgi:hypothetical protein